MMTAVKAYYDGKTFIPLQKHTFKPSQQVLIVVDEDDDSNDVTPAQKFLRLSWEGNESAEKILETIENGRRNSERFEAENELFD